MIDAEMRATIRRLHFNRHLTVNAVAEALGIHHDTVPRAIGTSRMEEVRAALSELEKYETTILDTLAIYPKLSASRIYLILKEQGYGGRLRSVQRWTTILRPRVAPRVFRTVNVLPGEQAQVDWGHFGSLTVGRASRKLSAFVMVLSYSRAIYVRFTFDQSLESLLVCHKHAFDFFSGVPRTLVYDNMKTVVSDRIGSKIRYQKDLVEFSGYYLFELSVCAPFQPQSKGRVERAVRYLRENFFAGRDILTIEQLNDQALAWCREVTQLRPWPDDHSFTVRDKLEAETPNLIILPEKPFLVRKHKVVRADVYGYVLFDKNKYSISADGYGKSLILASDHDSIQILDDKAIVAEHRRSWDQGQKFDQPSHHAGREKQLPRPRIAPHAAELIKQIPEARQLLENTISHDQTNTGTVVRWLQQTLNIHGFVTTEKIIKKAVDEKILTLDGMRSLLQIELNKAEPDIAIILPDNKEVRDLNFRSHTLDSYDQL